MARILSGAPVAAALSERTAAAAAALRARGIVPCLAIVRVGAREDAVSYEHGATRRCDAAGVAVKSVVLPENIDNAAFLAALDALNRDGAVHGILLLLPLPEQLDAEQARQRLAPEKDVDGCTDGSLAGVFSDTALGYPPCAAQAAMEMLDYYGIACEGRRAVVLGRSLVVGRPAALMLLHRNATVTLCHSKTVDAPAVAREAELLLVCTGRRESVGREYLRPGQTVIDVGVHSDASGQTLCGDVRIDEAEPLVGAITPVPGGVGSVTTSVLVSHVVEAASRAAGTEA